MELVALGLLGGCLMAALISRIPIQPRDIETRAGLDHRPLSPDDINMSSIRVAGVGGLGMVAVSVIVALTMPAIGVPVGAGLVTGTLMAWFLIHRRRRQGVMPSSTKGPGANTILAIDGREESAAGPTDAAPRGSARQGLPIRVPAPVAR
jgi:hypothetical protein